MGMMTVVMTFHGIGSGFIVLYLWIKLSKRQDMDTISFYAEISKIEDYQLLNIVLNGKLYIELITLLKAILNHWV